MPSKYINNNGKIINLEGNVVSDDIHSPDDKCYAVILKCGHCGDEFFIPIIFTCKCRDRETAVALAKTKARVKRDKKDAVLDSFQITDFERFFIELINDHDPYLKNYTIKRSQEILERRVINDMSNDYDPARQKYFKNAHKQGYKLSHQYKDYYVLERAYAPRFVGSKIVFSNRVNRRELLDEFFKQNTIRYGTRKADPFFMCLYYQMYGKNNDLGIVYYNGHLSFVNDNQRFSCEIPEKFETRLKQSIKEQEAKELKENKIEEISAGTPKVSAIDRFNSRMEKYKSMKKAEESAPSELGAE